MNQSDTPESLLQAARDRGKVLRCRPESDDVQRMDFCRIHGSVLRDRYAGYVPDEEASHIYRPEEVLKHLQATLEAGTVLQISEEHTRWGEFDYGSD